MEAPSSRTNSGMAYASLPDVLTFSFEDLHLIVTYISYVEGGQLIGSSTVDLSTAEASE